jgi:hypothetical protein
MTRRATVRQHDVTRVLRAARAAGLHVYGYEIDPESGRIVVNTNAPVKQDNPKGDLQWWLKHHGHKIYSNE